MSDSTQHTPDPLQFWDTPRQTAEQIEAERDALKAQRDELVEALRPFASLFALAEVVGMENDLHAELDCRVSVADLSRATSLIAKVEAV
jgi:hypothetical protein